MNKRKILCGAAWLVCGLLAACQRNPYAHEYLVRRPAASEVAGEYVLSGITVPAPGPRGMDRAAELSEKPRLTLFPDGRVLANRLPVFSPDATGWGYVFEGFRDVEGRWKIDSLGSVDDGWGKPKTYYGLHLEGFPEEYAFCIFTGDKRVSGLIFSFGDPDAGEAIRYSRAEDKT